jgi:hypothetical protein
MFRKQGKAMSHMQLKELGQKTCEQAGKAHIMYNDVIYRYSETVSFRHFRLTDLCIGN